MRGLTNHNRVVGWTETYSADGSTMTRWGRVLACHYSDKWKVRDIHTGRGGANHPATVHTIMPETY